MADMTCPKCAEPWDTHHVRNDAFEGDEYDGRENMPEPIATLYDEWLALDPWSGTPEEKQAADDLRRAYYDSGLAHGCEACWYEPERVLDGEARVEALRRAMFDSAWDGDPAAMFL